MQVLKVNSCPFYLLCSCYYFQNIVRTRVVRNNLQSENHGQGRQLKKGIQLFRSIAISLMPFIFVDKDFTQHCDTPRVF